MTGKTRRHASAYNSRDAVIDVEKQPFRPKHHRQHSHSSFDSDSGDDSVTSSAASYQPMLDSPARRRPRPVTGFYRVPNRIMRRLCFGLFIALVLFILTLFRFTIRSSVTQVPLEVPKTTPKPPQWESFPFLKRYHGDNPDVMGLGGDAEANATGLQARDEALPISSLAFDPYPNYTSPEYIAKYGEKRECFLDEKETMRIPLVHSYPGVPRGFPEAVMGSNEEIGIRDDVCFDRFGRLGPYGLGYSVRKGGIGAGLEGHREGAEHVWDEYPPVDFRKVDWAAAQNRCLVANGHRFKDLPQPRSNRFLSMPIGARDSNDKPHEAAPVDPELPQAGTGRLPRTAVIIRTWHDFHYTPEDILYLRSLISELSLLSGGEYTIHFLVHVKDENLQIWSDDETYERVLKDALPEEFRGMGTLWSERQMSLLYSGLEET
ncbi:hypothetical protein ANOM_004640 [Aspergillus nomiae NRRL 13137]|uniref:Uncharacterized protein n=1 Tax=Aspergillus nomiae NRRL (strain ATCC 15546 / NRRL 13137 / CBS 260.88 / M93) TaxID=1509407 RepID=A0A0L1J5V9_ASPN3|nr:uncharacterized protein ANOM_004640 [Aspergillus nomiae NRRL 13137]KNG86803.1 hypothetical protein ANOM_004640 [Aspergillus nomiae NRRL 13137]